MSTRSTNTSLKLGRFPLLWVALAFGAGVIVADALNYPAGPLTYWTTFALTSLLLVLALRRYQHEALRNYLSAAILLLCFAFGLWRAGADHLPNQADFFARQLQSDETQAATLASQYLLKIKSIRPGSRSLRLTTEIERIAISPDSLVAASGQLLLYLPPDGAAAALEIGDRLLVNGRPEALQPPLNPYAFDAAKYWATQGIFYQLFVWDSDSLIGIPSSESRLSATAEQWRNNWLNTFTPWLKGNELAVASALILGKKDLLTEDLRNAYADTGAVHVLAVSGLHVGIVTTLIALLFSPFRSNRRWWKFTQVLLTLAAIWAFALLTGLSPSVQRAALMFSIISVGRIWRRGAHLFNSLAAAGLLILFIDPKQLFGVGFQLSFAAVAGIGLFQSRLDKLVYSRWWLGRQLWSATAISLSATLGTLPFTLYYFHQFPLYFLLIGSAVVFSAFAIMIGGIAHALLSLLLPSLAGITGSLLNFTVELQNAAVFWGQRLPGARQAVDWISLPQLLLLGLAIFLAGLWLRNRDWVVLFTGLLALLGFALFGFQSSKEFAEQQRTVVYHQRQGRVIDAVSGKHALRWKSSQLDPEQLKYSAANHVQARSYRVDTTFSLPFFGDNYADQHAAVSPPLLDLPSGRWLLLKDDFQLPPATSNQQAAPDGLDFVLLNNTLSYFESQKLPGLQKTSLFILDGTAFRKTIRRWQTHAKKDGLRLHVTATDGALVVE